MKTKKTDRRSERTQRLLGAALVSLLQEKRYDAITTQDILDRANVGRSTFYEHYWDKEDLLSSEIERVIDLLNHKSVYNHQHDDSLLPSLALFQHVQEHHDLYQALLRGRGIEVATRALRDHLQVHIQTQLQQTHKHVPNDEALSITAFYVASAFVNFLQHWLETETNWSPDHINTLFRNLVLPGVQHYVEQSTMEKS